MAPFAEAAETEPLLHVSTAAAVLIPALRSLRSLTESFGDFLAGLAAGFFAVFLVVIVGITIIVIFLAESL